MSYIRFVAALSLVGATASGGCRDSASPSNGPGAGGAVEAPQPPSTGGVSHGGAPLGTGGSTGGEPLTGGTSGSGGTMMNVAGLGGDGAGGSGPLEPPIEPCAPLQVSPPESACPLGPFPALPLIEEEEEVILCTKSMNVEWAEGPIWSEVEQTLFFSNFDETDVGGLFNGDLMTYREGEGCGIRFFGVGTNGLAWGSEGSLIVGRQTNRTVSRMDLETGALCTLADAFESKRFSSPNDVAVRSDGNVYFTDPAWNLGEREEELPQSLYRMAPDGEVHLVSVYDEMRPNGVSLSPDESRLYVAIEGAILLFDVDSEGALSGERNFVTGTSVDGMAIDCAGNVYASSGHVYSPEGELVGEFWGGTNLAFGGPDRQTLYITGHRRLTSLRVAIPGMPY